MSSSGIPPASALADVLLLHGRRGVLSPPLRFECGASPAMVGPARTVQFEATAAGDGGTFDELYELLDQRISGQVIVAAGAEQVVGAVWGQILSNAAERVGAVGVLIAGSVRDHAELASSPLPVWGIGRHAMGATGQARVVAVDQPVEIGGVTVNEGDTVVADSGGAVCLPAELTGALIEQGNAYAMAEQLVLEDLASGVPLTRAYEHKRAMKRRLEAL